MIPLTTGLTARQQQILDFVKLYIAEHGWPPTHAEISAGFGFSSANAAHVHLVALQRHGRIETAPGISRGIRVLCKLPVKES